MRHARSALVLGCLAASARLAPAQTSSSAPLSDAPLAPPALPALEWQAPPGCPEREQVLGLVDTLTRDDAVDWRRFDSVRGRVSSRAGAWLLELEFERPSGVSRRRVESPRCADLAQAAAVAIVLAHRADEDSAVPWRDTDPAPDGRAEPAPAAASDAGELQPSGAQPNEPQSSEPQSSEPQSSEPQSSEPLGVALGARGVLDPTTLGTAALGVAAGGHVALGPWSAGLYGVWIPAGETSVAPGRAIALGLGAAGAQGCRGWVPGLRTCLGVELGQVRASSHGLEQPSSARDLWVTPNASLELSSQLLAAVAVTADAALLVPLIRGEYRVDEAEVHRIPPLAVRAGLGLRVQLLP
jgi:hypothetical protein